MSLGEFFACVEGWKRVHGAPEKPQPPSEEEFDRMVEETDN